MPREGRSTVQGSNGARKSRSKTPSAKRRLNQSQSNAESQTDVQDDSLRSSGAQLVFQVASQEHAVNVSHLHMMAKKYGVNTSKKDIEAAFSKARNGLCKEDRERLKANEINFRAYESLLLRDSDLFDPEFKALIEKIAVKMCRAELWKPPGVDSTPTKGSQSEIVRKGSRKEPSTFSNSSHGAHSLSVIFARALILVCLCVLTWLLVFGTPDRIADIACEHTPLGKTFGSIPFVSMGLCKKALAFSIRGACAPDDRVCFLLNLLKLGETFYSSKP